MRVCSQPGCPTIYDGTASRCPAHRKQAEQAHSRKGKGYKTKAHLIGFRAAVLRRDPICVLCGVAQSTDADHYPTSRVDLIDQGLNPNDPVYGRGLCHPCHSRSTSHEQPGGWNARD